MVVNLYSGQCLLPGGGATVVSGQCAVRNGGQFIHRSVAGGCAVAGSSENDARSF